VFKIDISYVTIVLVQSYSFSNSAALIQLNIKTSIVLTDSYSICSMSQTNSIEVSVLFP